MPARRKSWIVDFDEAAVRDLEGVKSRSDRRAVFTAIHKLKELGPDLPAPHMKSLKGERDLFELRPRQGSTAARPIYVRLRDRFLVLAVAAKKTDMDRAIGEARERLKRRR